MTFVVDANIAVHWIVRSPWSSQALQLLRHERLIAPDFIIVEVANAFRSESIKSTELLGVMRDGLEFLPRWFAELAAGTALRQAAFDIALRIDHSVYDCVYLALAAMRNAKMVTTDSKFIRKTAMDCKLEPLIMHLADWKLESS